MTHTFYLFHRSGIGANLVVVLFTQSLYQNKYLKIILQLQNNTLSLCNKQSKTTKK